MKMMKMIVEVIEILAARSTQEKKWHGQLLKSEPYEIPARASLGGVRGAQGVLGKQAEVISQRGR